LGGRVAGMYHTFKELSFKQGEMVWQSLGLFEGANVRIARGIVRGLGPKEVGWEVIQRKGR